MGSISPRAHYAIDVGFEVVSTATTTEYRHNIFADGEVIAVHDVHGCTNVAGGRMPGATTIDQSGNAYTDYLHHDHLGSVDTITDDQGNVIQAMSFDAFGQRRVRIPVHAGPVFRSMSGCRSGGGRAHVPVMSGRVGIEAG